MRVTTWITCVTCGHRWPFATVPDRPTEATCFRCEARTDPESYVLSLVHMHPRRTAAEYARLLNSHLEEAVVVEQIRRLWRTRRIFQVDVRGCSVVGDRAAIYSSEAEDKLEGLDFDWE